MLKLSNQQVIWVLIILHFVGILGFVFLPAFFIFLVPFHLITIAYLLFKDVFLDQKSFLTILLISLLAWLVEVAGVNTGLIFGEYIYGDVLAWKVWETPLLIGINWGTLVYSAYIISRQIKVNTYLQDIIGAFMVLLLDILLEPVAVQYGWWGWKNEVIPFKNYVSWFTLALILLQIFRLSPPKKVPFSLAICFLSVQILFFILIQFLT
jgi:putative membrane protein